MNTDLILPAATVLAGLFVLTGWRRTRRHGGRRPVARATSALACAAELVRLVAQVQQHRGMSGAWLAGDASFEARLPERQAAVNQLLAALQERAAEEEGEASPCFVTNDIRLLRHRWRELVDGLGGITPEQSFQAHCRIIATLLEWLGALGESRIEQPLAQRVPGAAVRNFSHRLPVLAESLGQARALGSAVAAKGHCPPVSRVRLLFLVSRAESLLSQAMAVDDGGAAAARAQARQAVGEFVGALRARLLAAAVDLGAGECFALGTRAVDAVFAWLAVERGHIEAALLRGAGAPPPFEGAPSAGEAYATSSR